MFCRSRCLTNAFLQCNHKWEALLTYTLDTMQTSLSSISIWQQLTGNSKEIKQLDGNVVPSYLSLKQSISDALPMTHLSIHSMLFHAQASADVDLIHSCGSYVGRLQNWISSRFEEQIWLEKLPNQICSRPVECNASCLIVWIGLGNTFSWVNSGASHGFNELQQSCHLCTVYGGRSAFDSFSFFAHPQEGLLLVTHTQYFHQLIVSRSKRLTNE